MTAVTSRHEPTQPGKCRPLMLARVSGRKGWLSTVDCRQSKTTANITRYWRPTAAVFVRILSALRSGHTSRHWLQWSKHNVFIYSGVAETDVPKVDSAVTESDRTGTLVQSISSQPLMYSTTNSSHAGSTWNRPVPFINCHLSRYHPTGAIKNWLLASFI